MSASRKAVGFACEHLNDDRSINSFFSFLETGETGEISSLTSDSAFAPPNGGQEPSSLASILESQRPGIQYPHQEQSAAPKSLLYALYGKKRIVIQQDSYVTWSVGEAHIPSWTSVFVCPFSGEVFKAAPYRNAVASPCPNGSSLVWFSGKKQAEHGAAALAYDCLVHRNVSHQSSKSIPEGDPLLLGVPILGQKRPYLKGAFAVTELPACIQERVQSLQRQSTGFLVKVESEHGLDVAK